MGELDTNTLIYVILTITGSVGGMHGASWVRGKIARSRNGGEDPQYAMVPFDKQEVTNPNLRPVTQGEYKTAEKGITSKIDDQSKQISNLENTMNEIRITLTKMSGDLEVFRAGLSGQLHQVARKESERTFRNHEKMYHYDHKRPKRDS
jgi:hypothetical protein